MLKVLMLDLGGTLVQENPLMLLPHAAEALSAFNSMETADGQPLPVCLVSNFHPTAAEVQGIFNDYVALLGTLGVKQHFEPVSQRVTLSTHTAVFKPDRRVFKVAVERLGVAATLDECIFITEDAGHTAAARGYGITALQFGADFQSWSVAPSLIQALLENGA